MREDEVVSLRVRDVIEGPDEMGTAFDLSRSKTQAGVRMVPMHSDLMESVARGSQARSPPSVSSMSSTRSPTQRIPSGRDLGGTARRVG